MAVAAAVCDDEGAVQANGHAARAAEGSAGAVAVGVRSLGTARDRAHFPVANASDDGLTTS